MKRLRLILICFAFLGAMSLPGGNARAAAGGKAKVIGYYMDASDDYYKAGFQVFKALAANAGWQVLDVVGQGTAPEQISAVEDFITQKVDALVVVQNSPAGKRCSPKRPNRMQPRKPKIASPSAVESASFPGPLAMLIHHLSDIQVPIGNAESRDT